MSNVQKFNENLFTEWSLMTFPDYEKEYSNKFKRTSKNIKKYYEMYTELYNSSSESSSDEETDNEHQKAKPFDISRGAKRQGEQETKVVVNTNTAISSFFMEFNGFKIRQRPSDGYIHATDMCKVGKKRFNDYSSVKITKNFIKQLSADTNILVSALITSIKGGNDKHNQGTWIHPRIAINLAQWISPQFAVKVTDWVQKFIEGDETFIVDAVKHRENVKNITSSVSLVDIDNNLNLSESEKHFELIQMHKNNITKLQKQLNEKEGIIIKKDEQIDRMEKC